MEVTEKSMERKNESRVVGKQRFSIVFETFKQNFISSEIYLPISKYQYTTTLIYSHFGKYYFNEFKK